MTRAELIQAAYALQMAAILLRDLDSAMTPRVREAMPADLRNRMQDHCYQEAFYGFPEDIQASANMMVASNPDIQAAKRIHAGGEDL